LNSKDVKEMFLGKRRYFIFTKHISKDKNYRNVDEVGGGGLSYLSYINKHYKIRKVIGVDLFINKKLSVTN
jgi:hypothetical protein